MTEMTLPGPQRPQVDDLGFDRRLMSAERLLTLAGKQAMRFSEGGLPNVYLDCTDCGKAIEVLSDKVGGCYRITAGQLLANVLRHLVMRHDLSLSGGSNAGDNEGAGRRRGPGPRAEDAARPGGRAGDRGPGGAADRPGHEEGDPRRVEGTAGGDPA